MNKALEVKQNLYWVGTRDFDIEVFDIVMRTENGTTYNSYLIKGSEKTALVEICKEQFFDDYLENISSICDIKNIDYVITNHTEPDHSGSIKKLVELNESIVVYGSKIAISYLNEIANIPFNSVVVKEGDTLSLGNYNFTFISTPFLHWPDSMMTYCKELKTLFTCDMFGSHFCSNEIFNDLITTDFMSDYKYYYDAIFSPFKEFVLKGISKIENLDFDTICNGHGPVLRKDLDKYIGLYKQWSQPVKNDEPHVVIAYVSAYGYTKKIAEQIAKGISTVDGIVCESFDLTFSDMNEVKEKVEKADCILFGSPTILCDALPPVYEVMSILNPVIHKGKIAGAFGSYGWSGEAVSNLNSRIRRLKLDMPYDSIKVKFNPNDADLRSAFDYGQSYADYITEKFKNK